MARKKIAEKVQKWRAVITFLPKKGKEYELVSIKLKLKPCTFKRAVELVEAEGKKCKWPYHYRLDEF